MIEKVAHQRGLAHARAAVNIDGDGLAFAGRAKRVVQFGQQAFAPDESRVGGCGQCAGLLNAERAQHLAAGRSRLSVAPQKFHAQVVEVLRSGWIDLEGLDGIARLLAHHDFEKFAFERQPSSQRLIQHHADAVPIAGFRDRHLRPLLGGHVIRRARQERLVQFWLNVFDQAKVENDHAAVAVHEHVRRLDVTMQLAHLVQAIDAFSELPQRRPQARFIELVI